jgi:small-conductance mechanosensitive channel
VSNRFLRAVLSLYPRGFRRRYGTEVQDLVNDLEAAGDRSRLSLVSGLLMSAAAERLRAVLLDIRLAVPALLAVAALGTIVGLDGSRSGRRSPRAAVSAGTHVWRAFRASGRLGSGTSSSGIMVVEAVPMGLRNGWPVVELTPPPPPPRPSVEAQG